MPDRSPRPLLKTLLACAALLFATIGVTQADTPYPARAVKVIVPYPSGQATDLAARLLADELARRWGRAVYVENRAGGAAIPGVLAGKEAAPDGYTLMLGTSAALVINPALFAQLPYDPFKDFVYVVGFFRNPLLIVANAEAPYQSLDDLVKAAKAAPGKINWGYPGTGNAQHLTGELFKTTAGIDLVNIMYKGSAQAVTDLLGNQIPLTIDSIPATLSNIKAGRLRPLAVTGAHRAPQLPTVPTVAELGYTGFEGEGWGGIVAPKGTPPEVVAKVEQTVQAVLADPSFQARLIEAGLVPYQATHQEFESYAKGDLRKWADVARRAGIEPQ